MHFHIHLVWNVLMVGAISQVFSFLVVGAFQNSLMEEHHLLNYLINSKSNIRSVLPVTNIFNNIAIKNS